MLIKREPPPIDEIAKRLAAQNATRGNRATIETIGNPDAC